MTKDEILSAAKELHYSEKLDLAQKLIQIARKDLEQITCQLQPHSDIVHSSVAEKKEAVDVSSASSNPSVLSLDDIIERLKKLRCKKEKTILNSIMAMYQFRGGITEDNAKKLIQNMIRKKVSVLMKMGM